MEERSKSGAAIHRYDNAGEFQWKPADGEPLTDEISVHIEKHVGPIEMVYHELVSSHVHIDVHWVKPSEAHPYHTFVTSGMSDKPMNVPEESEALAFAELCLTLPITWKVSEEDFDKEENYWPIWWLKFLARFPHVYNTWFCQGHTIPNAEAPFAKDTQLASILFFPPMLFGEDFRQLKVGEKTINFYNLIPLYAEELALKLNEGIDTLLDKLDAHQITDIWQLKRVNTAL